MQPIALVPWIAIALALAVFAPRIRTPIVGWILVVTGVAVFAVRLHHAGPYPFPGPVDLAAGCAALVLGALLVRSPWSRSGEGRATAVTRVLLFLSPVVFVLALVAYGHEAEEVIVLRTTTPEGDTRETRLWIVDLAGAPWVVTGREGAHSKDLVAQPRVEILRDGETRCFVAESHHDRPTVETLLQARTEKYLAQRLALASRMWPDFKQLEDLEEIAVAIRFVPCDS